MKLKRVIRRAQVMPDLVMVKAAEKMYVALVRTNTKHRLTRAEADELRTNIRTGRERVEMILHG